MIGNDYISKRLFEIETGNVPIVLSCPHGGFKKPKFIPNNKQGVQLSDKYTVFFTRRIIYALKLMDIKLFYIISKIHRIKVDLNRPPGTSAAFEQYSTDARDVHFFFHNKVKYLAKECLRLFGKCLFIDFHGFTKPRDDYQDIIFGNIFSNTLSIKSKVGTTSNDEFWGLSELKTQFLPHFSMDDGRCVNDISIGYSGGYITHQFYRKNNINAIQLEIADNIRNDLSLTNLFIDDFIKGIINCVKNA